jgi:tetratricopeptide (TPR) repeat protein
MNKFSLPLDYLHALDRYRYLMILNAAKECQEYQFTKQATMMWLVNYPGDLYVQYHQALALAQLDNKTQAKTQFKSLVEYDPSFIEPVQAMVDLEDKPSKKRHFERIIQFLTQQTAPETGIAAWLRPLFRARRLFKQGDYEEAIVLIHQSLVKDPPSPIPAVLHLKTVYKMKNQDMLANLCDIYYEKYPNCLQVNIIKALSDIELGKEADGVERLHWAAAHDTAAQVIQRLLGSDHRFKDMWPEKMEIYFDLPIPASISTHLGWNQLQTGTGVSPELKQKPVSTPIPQKPAPLPSKAAPVEEPAIRTRDIPEKFVYPGNELASTDEKKWATEEDFEEIQKVFSKLAKRLKVKDLERSDNRFPVYVILSSKTQLDEVYGPNTAAVIDEQLNELTNQIGKQASWGSLLFYPDDASQMSQFGLKPVITTDAWKVKLALADLDEYLATQGEMIGALLIAGGPEIVPFHQLPNPTTDSDLEVSSDNPYSTIDENYFIPQWPVGRLPGETGSDAGLLLFQIRELIYRYGQMIKGGKSLRARFSSLYNWFRNLITSVGNQVTSKQSLGYSAEIWKVASCGVFSTVGRIKDLQLCPPINSGNLEMSDRGHKIGYFNLHGVQDGPNWYGQKDFSSGSSGPDYPVALSPDMFSETVPSPKLVFSEACYGANIIDKEHDQSISLKFLDSGTSSFVGSTGIAYGSVTLPLIAADYLAHKFYKKVLEGQAAGYALMQAKLSLAEEMTKLQGFLDGEDQKTLLSFVLFGDPLAIHDGLKSVPKPLFRAKTHPAVRTISDSDMESSIDSSELPVDVNLQVKKMVEKYLPGLHNAQMHVNKSTGHRPDDGSDSRKLRKSYGDRYVVTLQKSYDANQQTRHDHYARMTFDRKGKLVKFTTSR